MLQKKIITIVCAIAILGIGACFLPPEHFPSPPLPPYLTQFKTFAIQVQDVCANNPIDGEAMSENIASNFNRIWKEHPLRARPFRAAGYNDPTLRITILRKSASNSGATKGDPHWDLQLITSSTLTASDGKVLWQEQNQGSHVAVVLDHGLPPERWNARVVMDRTAYSLAMSIGKEILNSAPSH